MAQTIPPSLNISQIVQDINTLSTFLAASQTSSISTILPVDIIILCVSAVLRPAINLFHTLEENPSSTQTLVLCGGLGHSTTHLYTSISHHPLYSPVLPIITGLPEARVLHCLLSSPKYFSLEKISREGMIVLVEDRSTNCSANAIESRKLLDLQDSKGGGDRGKQRILLMQDPTMSLRTKASFEKVYSDLPLARRPEIITFPGFVPKVKAKSRSDSELTDGGVVERLEFDLEEEIMGGGVWGMNRFLDLIMGEIPRLEAYGPRGKGSIVDVDVPGEVRAAWERLDLVIGEGRGR